MHVQGVQKYCFSLSNMQICGVFVAVVVVVALPLGSSTPEADLKMLPLFLINTLGFSYRILKINYTSVRMVFPFKNQRGTSVT